jgi:hypothetical protein
MRPHWSLESIIFSTLYSSSSTILGCGRGDAICDLNVGGLYGVRKISLNTGQMLRQVHGSLSL